MLDLADTELGPAATTALLYNMPSLTSLSCRSLSSPSQHTAVSQLRRLHVEGFGALDLSVLAPIRLGPHCSLELDDGVLTVYPGGEQEARLLRTAARNCLFASENIDFFGAGDEGDMCEEASVRMVGALAAGLAELDGCKTKFLRLRSFTLRRSSAAVVVGLLQAAPLVDSLALW